MKERLDQFERLLFEAKEERGSIQTTISTKGAELEEIEEVRILEAKENPLKEEIESLKKSQSAQEAELDKKIESIEENMRSLGMAYSNLGTAFSIKYPENENTFRLFRKQMLLIESQYDFNKKMIEENLELDLETRNFILKLTKENTRLAYKNDINLAKKHRQ